jgi:O-antigen/teichoic acid export membrane protein
VSAPTTADETPSETPPAAPSGAIDRVLRGTAALGLVAVLNTFGQLLVVPVALAFWGPTAYGEWIALTALITSLTLTDLGVQTHVVNRMCAHHARGDRDAFLFDMHSALRVQVPLALGLLALGALAFAVLPTERWFGFETIGGAGLYAALLFLAAEILLWVPMGVVAGTYRASGRLAWAAVMQAAQRLAQIVLPLGLIALGGGIPSVTFTRLAVALASFAWILVDLRRLYPWVRFWPLAGSTREGARMLGPGALFLLTTLSDYIALQGTILVLQHSLGGAEVAVFNTHRTAINMGRMISAQLTFAAWPELTVLDTHGDTSSLVRAHRSLAKVNGYVVGAALLGFLPIAQPVYEAWTLGKLAIDPATLALLTAQTILWGFWRGGATLLSSTNRQGRLVPLLFANAIAGVVIAYLLIPSMGIRGAALGGLIGDLVIATWAVPLTTCRALGDTLLGYLRETIPIFLIALVLPAVLSGAIFWALPWQTAKLVVTPIVFGGLSLPLFLRLLEPDERAAARRMGAAVAARLGRLRRAPS